MDVSFDPFKGKTQPKQHLKPQLEFYPASVATCILSSPSQSPSDSSHSKRNYHKISGSRQKCTPLTSKRSCKQRTTLEFITISSQEEIKESPELKPSSKRGSPKEKPKKKYEILSSQDDSVAPPLKPDFETPLEKVPVDENFYQIALSHEAEFRSKMGVEEIAKEITQEIAKEVFDWGPATPDIIEALACKEGTLQYRNGTYVGEYSELIPNGKGVWRLPNGDSYEGEWLNGEFHGQGSYICANGNFYSGGWSAGAKEGQGILLFRNGDVYEGEWRRGCMHGKGKGQYGVNGDYYEGEWQENKWHGHGTYFFAKGITFKGKYRKNKKEGKFIITTPKGSACELEFEENKPILGSGRLLKIGSAKTLQGKSRRVGQYCLDTWIKKT